MLQFEVFVGEFFSVDAFSSSSIPLGEVSALNHEIRNWIINLFFLNEKRHKKEVRMSSDGVTHHTEKTWTSDEEKQGHNSIVNLIFIYK